MDDLAAVTGALATMMSVLAVFSLLEPPMLSFNWAANVVRSFVSSQPLLRCCNGLSMGCADDTFPSMCPAVTLWVRMTWKYGALVGSKLARAC